MTTIKEVIDFLEVIAPLHLQESYDNAGLLLGEPIWEVKGVLTTLDATESVVDEAISLGANLIIAHHPIIFTGLKQISKRHHIGRTVIKAIQHNIAIYAIHTNLDNVLIDGVNGHLANLLELEHVTVLLPKDPQDPTVGSGVLGSLPQAMTFELFANYLKEKLKLGVVKHTAYEDEISQVALCGGAGRFLLEKAIESGADAFISSDFKYHDYFEANDQICIFDIGHFESERFTRNLLFDLVRKKFTNFAGYCSKVNTNPINYI